MRLSVTCPLDPQGIHAFLNTGKVQNPFLMQYAVMLEQDQVGKCIKIGIDSMCHAVQMLYSTTVIITSAPMSTLWDA